MNPIPGHLFSFRTRYSLHHGVLKEQDLPPSGFAYEDTSEPEARSRNSLPGTDSNGFDHAGRDGKVAVSNPFDGGRFVGHELEHAGLDILEEFVFCQSTTENVVVNMSVR